MNPLFAARPSKKISLTALIDVVFILLMFFMLTSSFSQWRTVDLAAPATATVIANSEPQLVFISPIGAFSLQDGSRVSATALAEQFNVEQAVVIIPDEQTQLQILVSGIEQLKNLGFSRVTLGKPSANEAAQ